MRLNVPCRDTKWNYPTNFKSPNCQNGNLAKSEISEENVEVAPPAANPRKHRRQTNRKVCKCRTAYKAGAWQLNCITLMVKKKSNILPSISAEKSISATFRVVRFEHSGFA